MRCKNCHTVMMDTDTHCPSCHSSVERATAAAPGPIANKPNGLLMALPIFGGALGGLAYAALTAGQHEPSYPAPAPVRTSAASRPTSGSRPVRRILGVLLMLGGVLFLAGGLMHVVDTLAIARREAKLVTAADLGREDYAKSAPSWIAYTFAESKATGQTVTRRRLGKGGEAQAQCLLVRVENHWLLATVAAGFEGDNLVGRIMPVDSPSSQSAIERARKQEPQLAILPYEFNAVEGCASDQQVRYVAGGGVAALGFAGMVLGWYLFRGRRAKHAEPAQNPEPANASWAFQAPTKV